MRMTIINARGKLHEKWMELTKDGTDEEMMQALSIADTVLGNYDEALKADMVAMLEEIENEFDKQYFINRHELHDDSLNRGLEQGQDIIRKEIISLMENTNGTNN